MLIKYFSKNIQTSLRSINFENAREIRIRLGKPIFIRAETEIKIEYIPTRYDLDETFARICRYSPYAYNEDIKRGYITLEGGCRVGICGDVVEGNTVKNISSLNIRVSRQVIGCSKKIINIIKGNVLIASPPGCGKTTMLRDIIRHLSSSGKNIGIADERGEISGSAMGQAYLDLGERSDVILNCKKSKAMEMLLRSMAPDIIAVDELGGSEDIKAVFSIIHSGVKLLATIHAEDIEEVKFRLGSLYEKSVFDSIVFLKGIGAVDKIYNKEFDIIWQ